jgi:hypothetical protein
MTPPTRAPVFHVAGDLINVDLHVQEGAGDQWRSTYNTLAAERKAPALAQGAGRHTVIIVTLERSMTPDDMKTALDLAAVLVEETTDKILKDRRNDERPIADAISEWWRDWTIGHP